MWLNTSHDCMHLEHVFLRELEDGTDLANAHATQTVTHIHSFFHRLAHDEASNHTAGKRITSTVRVDNVSSINLRRRVRNDGRLALHCPDGRLCSMCIRTVRGFDTSDGESAIFCAMELRSFVSMPDALAQASASDSLPITSSAYGITLSLIHI